MPNADHPERARLMQNVHNWFQGPFHAMGYDAKPRRCGTYWNIGHVYTGGVPAEQVGAFLANIRAYYGDRSVSVYVDGREVESILGPTLCAARCTQPTAISSSSMSARFPHSLAPAACTSKPSMWPTSSTLSPYDYGRLPARKRPLLTRQCERKWLAVGRNSGAQGVDRKLLEVAEQEGYALLLTADQSLRYQQHLADRQLAIIVLLSTSWPSIQRRIEAIQAAVERVVPGRYEEIAS